MATTFFNTARRVAVVEPLKAIGEHGSQALVTSASAYMSAMFSMQHEVLPWYVAIPLAVGFEWIYLRGLANSDRAGKTKWAGALTLVAMVTSIIYGVLYVLGLYGAIAAMPVGGVAFFLAFAHVVPMALLSLCAGNLQRVRKLLEVARNQKLVAVEDERNQRELDAATELRLEMQRKEAELELYMKAQRDQAQLKAEIAATRRVTKTATTAQPAVQPKVKSVILYNGVEYPTIQAAADAHGISRQAMSKRLAREAEA